MKASFMAVTLVLFGLTAHMKILFNPETKELTAAYQRQLRAQHKKQALYERKQHPEKTHRSLGQLHESRRHIRHKNAPEHQALAHGEHRRHFNRSPRFLKGKHRTRKLSKKTQRKASLLEPWYLSKEKKYEQYQRFGEIKRKMMQDTINSYLTSEQVNNMDSDALQEIHQVYLNDVRNIEKAKTQLLEQMDNIYNNFVNPGRWFY